MTIDRTLVIREPALVVHNSVNFFSKGTITIQPMIQRFGIVTALHGTIDTTRMADIMFSIKFTPAGEWESLSTLFPHGALAMGTSIFNAGTDVPLYLITRSGLKILFHNVSITKMPPIRMSVKETLLGEVEFTALLKDETDSTDAAAYYTITTGETYPGDAAFAAANIKTLAYASAWGGSSPWSSFNTADGWTIEPEMTLEPVVCDGLGTVDMRLADLRVTAKATPLGPTLAQVLTKLHQTSGLGASLLGNAANLNISASGVYVRVYAALLADAGRGAFAASENMVGECTWMGTRTITSGALDPLFYVGTASP
jgi:hypothetical protein